MSFVQRSAGTTIFGAATITETLTGTTSGNLIVAVVSWLQGSNGATPPSPTTGGWTQAISPNGVVCANNATYDMGAAIYWLSSPGGSVSMTINNFSSGGNSACRIRIGEWSGYLTSGVVDQTSSNNSPGGTPVTAGNTGTTGALAQNNELVVAVIGAMEINGSAALAFTDPASSGYTSLDLNNTSASSQSIEASWKEVTGGGTQTASWTWATAGEYMGVIATFKATGGAAASDGAAVMPRGRPGTLLGTPLSRLRGFYDDTPAVIPVLISGVVGPYSWAGTTSGVTTLIPDSEHNSLAINLLIGTPYSRLRGFYDDTPAPTSAINGVVGTYSWAGTTSSASELIQGGIGNYTWAGSTATINQEIDGIVGAYSWSGTTATTSELIAQGVGNYSWVGTTGTLSGPISAIIGSYLWAGTTSGVSTTSGGQSPVFRRHAFRPRFLSS